MRTIALLLCCTLISGCATGSGVRFVQASPSTPAAQPDTRLLIEYVKRLPIGSRVKLKTTAGRQVNGTLMKVTDADIAIQPRTRVPEPPLEIPLNQVQWVELDPGSSAGKTFGIALAAGAAGTLAVLLILIAALADD